MAALLLGIGLAMPGPFDVDKMSFVGPTTLESWRGVAVAQRLSEATGLPPSSRPTRQPPHWARASMARGAT